mmetsp:Transcript_27043/g.47758  ORF Transcript_27043/g.47758 Transcript_27043/m.47758 type:complete len:200 (+) Transcript_27043:53-652(+)
MISRSMPSEALSCRSTLCCLLSPWNFFSLDTVRQVLKQPSGTELYVTSIAYNLINHFVLGVPAYMLCALFFCSEDPDSTTLTWIGLVTQVLFVLVAQSLQYYFIHKTFHESPKLYQTFHRFHHRFSIYVPPSAANAVTCGEYFLAYVAPFGVAALIGRTSVSALRLAVMITSVLNVLVHMPRIESWSKCWVPFFLGVDE